MAVADSVKNSYLKMKPKTLKTAHKNISTARELTKYFCKLYRLVNQPFFFIALDLVRRVFSIRLKVIAVRNVDILTAHFSKNYSFPKKLPTYPQPETAAAV